MVEVSSLLELFVDGTTGVLAGGALKKLLKASLPISIVVEFDGSVGPLLVGDDKPSKSDDPELLSTDTRVEDFGLFELP